MKKVFLILMFSASLNVYSQNKIKYISYYRIKKIDDTTHRNFFKIAKELFSFNYRTEDFYKNDSLLLKCPEDSLVTYEVYEDKFLIASYYPNSHGILQLGPGFRPKGKFIIMSLKNPGKKWECDFKYQHNTESIIKFDPETRGLVIKDTYFVKPKSP